MTVVARFIIDDWPLLFGDLLLSRRANSSDLSHVDLPTTRVRPAATEVSDVLCGLCQKIALFGDHVAIAWSGSRSAAEDVLYELSIREATEKLNLRTLNDCFDRQRKSVWKKLGLLGFVSEPGLNIAGFSRSARTATSAVLGTVRLAGTGSEALAKCVEDSPNLPLQRSVELNRANRAVLHGFLLAGRLLNVEIHTGENLADVYGGGYELATLSGDSFIKVGNVTYVYWRARYVSNDEIYLTDTPKRVFRYAYSGDLMVIRAWEPISAVSFSQTLHVIPPVYRPVTPDEQSNLPLPDMNATWLCNYVLVEADGKRPWIASSIAFRPNPVSQVRFYEHQGRYVFSVESSFLQDIRKLILESPVLSAK